MLRNEGRFMLFVAAMTIAVPVAGLSRDVHATEHVRTASNKPSDMIKGTWYSAKDRLTFNPNGTIIYKGKRYYYAVSSGGTIQLTGKRGSSLTIPYHLVGNKLTLTIDGKAIVYTRRDKGVK